MRPRKIVFFMIVTCCAFLVACLKEVAGLDKTETIKDTIAIQEEIKDEVIKDEYISKVEVKKEIVMLETEEVVYATTILNLRQQPGMNATIIKTVGAATMLVQIGDIKDGWSEIKLTNEKNVYASSSYLSKEKPEVQVAEDIIEDTTNQESKELNVKEEKAEPEKEPVAEKKQSFVASLEAANKTNQIIAVVGNGNSSATISVHQKKGDVWTELFSTTGFVGRNGVSSNKKEGDGKTPDGVYSLGTAFGIASNPGTDLSYKKVTDSDYWVDDVNSEYYNQWVDIDETGKQWSSAEHLIEATTPYKYTLAINYNTACKPGEGSAIFLHCSNGRGTSGCVSVPEDIMIQILDKVNSSTLIVISENSERLVNY